MKKVFGWILIIGLVIGLVGCNEVSNANIDDTSLSESNQDLLKKVMDKYNLQYMGKDIEFDIENHLDQEFLLIGEVSLSDYFNYGFNNLEEYCFCIKIEPLLDTSQNNWYIYLDRKDFKKLYDKLVEDESFQVVVIGEIPKIYYEKGQGTLAIGNKAFW